MLFLKNVIGGPAQVEDVVYYKTFNDGSLAGWSGSGISQNQATIVNNGFNGMFRYFTKNAKNGVI